MMTNRYFVNPYKSQADFSEEKAQVDPEEIKNAVLSLVEKVLASPVLKNLEGGFYVGASGVTYMIIHMNRSPYIIFSPSEKIACYKMGQKALTAQISHYNNQKIRKNDLPAFVLGKAGIDAVGAVFYNLIGDIGRSQAHLMEYSAVSKYCKPLDFLPNGGDELFIGRAGYLCGALWLQESLGMRPVPQQELKDIWLAIIQSGRNYSKKNKSPCPLLYSYYGTEYLGAAHGLSSILQILLSFPNFCQEFPKYEELIKRTIDFFLTLQSSSGNFPPEMDDIRLTSSKSGARRSETEELVHFCHGAPGVIYMLAKAYLHFKDKKYLDACILCGEVIWEKGLLRKGPGICHGVAGNAYAFLLLFRLTNNSLYVYQAKRFYEFMQLDIFRNHSRLPDSPYSLFEGTAGTACFLTDLIDPYRASFPFFNVHYNYIPEIVE